MQELYRLPGQGYMAVGRRRRQAEDAPLRAANTQDAQGTSLPNHRFQNTRERGAGITMLQPSHVLQVSHLEDAFNDGGRMPGEIQRFGICVPKQTAQVLRDPLLLGQAIDSSLNVRPAHGTEVGLDHALALASRDIGVLPSMNRVNDDTHLLNLL